MSESIMELVGRAHLTWKRRVARDLAPYGLNPKQIYVLRRADETGGLAPSAIAEELYADRPTVTSMLRTLERNGWVARRSDPADGRRVRIELTARGRRKVRGVPESLWRTGRTEIDPKGGLEPDEQATLVRLLTKLNRWLEAACGGAAERR